MYEVKRESCLTTAVASLTRMLSTQLLGTHHSSWSSRHKSFFVITVVYFSIAASIELCETNETAMVVQTI